MYSAQQLYHGLALLNFIYFFSICDRQLIRERESTYDMVSHAVIPLSSVPQCHGHMGLFPIGQLEIQMASIVVGYQLYT